MARKQSEAGHRATHSEKKNPLRDHVAGRREGKKHEQARNPKTGRFVKER
jgi:hypothetical protein